MAQAREISRYSRRGEAHLAHAATEAVLRTADLRSAGTVHLAVPMRTTGITDGGDALEMVSSRARMACSTWTNWASCTSGPTFVLLAGCPARREPDLQGPPAPAMARALFQAGARSVVRCSWGAATAAADRYVLALYESLAEGMADRRGGAGGEAAAAAGRSRAIGLGRVRAGGRRPAPASAAAPRRLAALVARGGGGGGLAHLAVGAAASPPAGEAAG